MWVGFALVSGCDPAVHATAPGPGPSEPATRNAVADGIRISLALRAVRPSTSELDALEADPGALDAMIDGWLTEDTFLRTVRAMHSELLNIGSDIPIVWPRIGPLETATQAEVHRAFAESPLVRISAIVSENRPYTDIFVGNDPWVDPIVAAAQGLDYDPAGPVWQESRWIDGRPANGVLSETRFWTRYATNLSAKHRGRAEIIADLFLCDDIGGRLIEPFDPVHLDPGAETAAVTEETACLGCHNTLEPLASAMWGWPYGLRGDEILAATDAGCTGDLAQFCYPVSIYTPGAETSWVDYGMPAPAFYGTPLATPDDLGATIAADPRAPTCAARRAAAHFWRMRPGDVDSALVTRLAEDFVDQGLSYRSLIRSIVTDPDWLDAAPVPMTPDALGHEIAALTGFVWTADIDVGCEGTSCWGEPVDLLRTDRQGFRNLAGGADGHLVMIADPTVTPTRILALDALAKAAAEHVVRVDLAEPQPELRMLLKRVDADTIDRAAVQDQLAQLLWQMIGTRATLEEIDELFALFEVGRVAEGEPAGGWRLVLRTLLADPAVVNR